MDSSPVFSPDTALNSHDCKRPKIRGLDLLVLGEGPVRRLVHLDGANLEMEDRLEAAVSNMWENVIALKVPVAELPESA